jgi:hypothetical protein
MKLTSKEDIESFLQQFRQLAKKRIWGPKKADILCALSELGITLEQCHDIVLSLTFKDYFNGPEADIDCRGVIWEFGVLLDDCHEIYVKLKIAEWIQLESKIKEQEARIISFHLAKKMITYPYQDNERKGTNERVLPKL